MQGQMQGQIPLHLMQLQQQPQIMMGSNGQMYAVPPGYFQQIKMYQYLGDNALSCPPVGENTGNYMQAQMRAQVLKPEKKKKKARGGPVGGGAGVCKKSKNTGETKTKGRKPCRMDGCKQIAASRTPYCKDHCGARTCEKEGCSKCAQGRTRFCIVHGGGRRCTFPGCRRGSRDKYFCAAHGGGRRCQIEGCAKSAVGGFNFCTSHGGGKRCQFEGCTKSAQSSTSYCVRHGGGKKCKIPGCGKVARGKLNCCVAHSMALELEQGKEPGSTAEA